MHAAHQRLHQRQPRHAKNPARLRRRPLHRRNPDAERAGAEVGAFCKLNFTFER